MPRFQPHILLATFHDRVHVPCMVVPSGVDWSCSCWRGRGDGSSLPTPLPLVSIRGHERETFPNRNETKLRSIGKGRSLWKSRPARVGGIDTRTEAKEEKTPTRKNSCDPATVATLHCCNVRPHELACEGKHANVAKMDGERREGRYATRGDGETSGGTTREVHLSHADHIEDAPIRIIATMHAKRKRGHVETSHLNGSDALASVRSAGAVLLSTITTDVDLQARVPCPRSWSPADLGRGRPAPRKVSMHFGLERP